jgi:hypothetical protein
MVLSLLVTMPFQAFVSQLFIRRHITMTWLELARALWKSAAVTIACAIGPAAVTIACYPSRVGLASAIIAIALSALGWTSSIWLLRHPARQELRHATDFLARPFRNPVGPTRTLASLPKAAVQQLGPGIGVK